MADDRGGGCLFVWSGGGTDGGGFGGTEPFFSTPDFFSAIVGNGGGAVDVGSGGGTVGFDNGGGTVDFDNGGGAVDVGSEGGAVDFGNGGGATFFGTNGGGITFSFADTGCVKRFDEGGTEGGTNGGGALPPAFFEIGGACPVGIVAFVELIVPLEGGLDVDILCKVCTDASTD